jgi:hypothetical protein
MTDATGLRDQDHKEAADQLLLHLGHMKATTETKCRQTISAHRTPDGI